MAKRRNLDPNRPEQFLLIDSILKLTGKSRATLYRWVKAGSILWKRTEYNQWAKKLQKVNY